jgi:hypothetical protein
MWRSVLVLVLALTLAAATATAQERPWVARFHAGSATIHEWGASGGWAEAQVGRSFGGGVLSADLGLAVSGSDGGYASLTAGLEALPFPKAIVSPFARAEAGVLGEPEYGGYVAAIGGGLSVRLSDRLSLRGGATWGTHGDVQGPVVYYGGLQLRW